MNRREFISNTCISCLGGVALSNLLASCGASHYVTGTLEGKGISIPLSEFSSTEKGKQIARQYIVVHHDQLEFPIYVYHVSETEFTALLMKCAHQGSELNAAGDHLYCSSHGSEYDSRGNVTHGPAQKNLRSFPTSVNDNKVIIELTRE